MTVGGALEIGNNYSEIKILKMFIFKALLEAVYSVVCPVNFTMVNRESIHAGNVPAAGTLIKKALPPIAHNVSVIPLPQQLAPFNVGFARI